VRVLTWNVRALRDDAAGAAGAGGVARVLREAAPDIVLVQESPHLWRWRSACARLARQADLVVVTGGRPAVGNLILCSLRVGVETAYDVRLPKRRSLPPRGAAMAVLSVDGRRLGVLGTHLDLDPAARKASAGRVRAAAPLGVPLLIGADVNEEPGGPAWRALSDGLADVGDGLPPTFSVTSPRRRIDGLFAGPELRVVSREVLEIGPVSDHKPVLAELAWA
jgi:endonuclease/exonuclease/phosphatase family metal-dependent hydrolase